MTQKWVCTPNNPIGLARNNPTLYGYVGDVNKLVDLLVVSVKTLLRENCCYIFLLKMELIHNKSNV